MGSKHLLRSRRTTWCRSAVAALLLVNFVAYAVTYASLGLRGQAAASQSADASHARPIRRGPEQVGATDEEILADPSPETRDATDADAVAASPSGVRYKTPVFFDACLSPEEAAASGVYQLASARPKGMSSKEFADVKRCWRRRKTSEPLFPATDLPSLDGIPYRMTEDQKASLLFVHRANVPKLGLAISGGDGATLADLFAEGSRDAHDALPEDAEAAMRTQRHADCAVVASGGSLAGARLGARIDAHEIVVRLNQAPTAVRSDLRRDIGTRTSLRLINNLWTQKYSQADLEKAAGGSASGTPLERNATLYVTRPGMEEFVRLTRHQRQARPDVTVRLVSSRVISHVRDKILVPYRARLQAQGEDALTVTLLEGRDTPSSGLVAVFVMLQLCDRVTAYGFSGLNDGRGYHYWKSNRQYQNRTHSFSAERALLRRLALELSHAFAFVEGAIKNVKSFV